MKSRQTIPKNSETPDEQGLGKTVPIPTMAPSFERINTGQKKARFEKQFRQTANRLNSAIGTGSRES
jgi:hypothetical protein